MNLNFEILKAFSLHPIEKFGACIVEQIGINR